MLLSLHKQIPFVYSAIIFFQPRDKQFASSHLRASPPPPQLTTSSLQYIYFLAAKRALESADSFCIIIILIVVCLVKILQWGHLLPSATSARPDITKYHRLKAYQVHKKTIVSQHDNHATMHKSEYITTRNQSKHAHSDP